MSIDRVLELKASIAKGFPSGGVQDLGTWQIEKALDEGQLLPLNDLPDWKFLF